MRVIFLLKQLNNVSIANDINAAQEKNPPFNHNQADLNTFMNISKVQLLEAHTKSYLQKRTSLQNPKNACP